MGDPRQEGGTGTIERQREDLREPPKFRVVLHNDDYTPQEFVVQLLVHVFNHEEAQAERIMLQVHNSGAGTAGVFTREIAETKCAQCISIARGSDYPLEVTFEPEA